MLVPRALGSLTLLLAASHLPSLVFAVSSTSFCKCVCGLNSTIIPLDGTPLDAPASRAGFTSPQGDPAGNALTPPAPKQNEIFDPADQGYDLPPPEADYFQRRQASDFEPMPDLKDSYDHDPALEHSPAEPTPTPGAAAEEDEGSLGNSTETQLVSPKRAGTCSDCNRQFCLDHPDFGKMCGEAKEEEVTTTCFKRDSAKDQLVVYTFIFVTVGLLGYAAVRPWIERKYAAVRERRSYVPVPSGQGS